MVTGYIQTHNLSRVYDGQTWALNNVNLTIEEGDWVSIIGPSGSGKTTLLNMIGCLDKPTEGSVVINGITVNTLNQRQLTQFRREQIGLIFQQHYLIPYLTALENVLIAMYYHSSVNEKKAIEVLAKVGIEHQRQLNNKPSKLSGGEQQRVCIARALINEPKILVADEPTGNLDQKNGQVVMDLIHNLYEVGHTILLVTHNMDIAKQGNQILQIVDGKVWSSN
ncbi:MAG: ABC transporter ATP-binding protein [Candidatus Heimdallarchaeota archaeon]|nr:MAG: ABC transporter ATP-binding protein [Candidatus Heimdallarchaeota archaeon]